MARVFVAVGSNVDRAANVRAGVCALREAFGDLTVSPVYQSRAVGFEGEDFYNLVVAFDTDRGPREVAEVLHGIERRFGRARSAPRFSPRALDLDLLLYNDLVASDRGLVLPREDIGRYAFVLRPLAEIAGERRHPVSGKRFSELWAGFERNREALVPVSLDLEGNATLKPAES